MQFIFYRRLNEIAILKGAQTLQEEKNEVLYQKILGELLEQSYHLKLGQDLFKMYLCFLVANDENAFSLTAEKEGEGMDDNLKALVLKDLTTLIQLFHSQVITLSVKTKRRLSPTINFTKLWKKSQALSHFYIPL